MPSWNICRLLGPDQIQRSHPHDTPLKGYQKSFLNLKLVTLFELRFPFEIKYLRAFNIIGVAEENVQFPSQELFDINLVVKYKWEKDPKKEEHMPSTIIRRKDK